MQLLKRAEQVSLGLAQALGAPAEVRRAEEVAVLGEVLGGLLAPPGGVGAGGGSPSTGS
ncbi:hypothetical protein [Georgenia sp. SUBG003]|uniref:hypothetical protein n=1 Tax=Georgenia sp. SUBG003 TaxID=1497974 RepID=UPI003AB66171